MKLAEYHILNGDSLKERMTGIIGQKIVIRECLVVGDVKGASLTELFQERMSFFEREYDVSNEGYRSKVISEISKILQIKDGAIVNLWFENDLFCQVNFWFSVHILHQLKKKLKLFLVSPTVDSWLGFGAMLKNDLEEALPMKKEITQINQEFLSQLWSAYKTSSWQQLRDLSHKLTLPIDDLKNVVEAHIERFPEDHQLGRPHRSILKIAAELKDPTFGNIFKAFCKTEGIYGFGDLQVEHMIKELKLPIYK